jgi:transketolase
MNTLFELAEISRQVRRDIVRMVHGAKSGHPGGSLGCADILTYLFFNEMKSDPANFIMNGNNEDIFFLSNGHISPAFYSVLARRGFFGVNELATFRKLDSRLQGHPATLENLPGIRIASGSLGQGLSAAIGAALAKKLNNDKNLVYCLMGDGEVQEGQVWEAARFAKAHSCDNLIAIVDWNNRQIDGDVDKIMSGHNLPLTWESFGWTVLNMNGHDFADMEFIFQKAKSECNKGMPVVILAKTEMGMGVDFMMGTHKWHGSPPNDSQAQSALSQLAETKLGDY